MLNEMEGKIIFDCLQHNICSAVVRLALQWCIYVCSKWTLRPVRYLCMPFQ